jgi:hypothetical protein
MADAGYVVMTYDITGRGGRRASGPATPRTTSRRDRLLRLAAESARGAPRPLADRHRRPLARRLRRAGRRLARRRGEGDLRAVRPAADVRRQRPDQARAPTTRRSSCRRSRRRGPTRGEARRFEAVRKRGASTCRRS